MDSLKDLAAALEGHQVTDEEGQITGEGQTPAEEPAAQEMETTEKETAPAEKPAVEEQPAAQAEEQDDENQLAEDDSGKRYVPEKRFKEVYGKAKNLERELELLRQQAQVAAPTQQRNKPAATVDKTESLEIEFLRQALPQFNPESESYSRDLDEMGALIYAARPGITRLEAARQAIAKAKAIVEPVIRSQTEARKVKALQSDQGITNRVANRQATQVDPETMTDQELERYLRENGAW